MATIIVTLLCLVLVVAGGAMLSQGILSTADAAASGVSSITTREASINRSAVTDVTVESVTFDNALRVWVKNTGFDKLADYEHWDVIVNYTDAGGTGHAVWLPYTANSTPGDNEWTVAGIWQNGPNEYFDPGILNPQEELLVLAPLNPVPAPSSAATVTVIADNGVSSTMDFTAPAYGAFYPHDDAFKITGTDYFYLRSGVPDDSSNITETTGPLARNQVGRWLLYNVDNPTQYARHCFPLHGITSIPASSWNVTYDGYIVGQWSGNSWAQLNIDVLIRKKDGTVRQTLATGVATATFAHFDVWQVISASYDFPGYTVVDPTDMLEIDYYGVSTLTGPSRIPASINLNVDDSTIPSANQTRIDY